MTDWRKLASLIKGKSDWLNIITDSSSSDSDHTGNLKDIITTIFIELKKSHVGSAIALARVSGYKNFPKFIREIRRHGILRASKYSFETVAIRKFINLILDDEAIFKIAPNEKEYLLSTLNILFVADEIRNLRLDLVRQLRPNSSRVLKTLLVCVDRAFWPISEEQIEDYHRNNSILSADRDHSVESLASGFSTLLAMLSKSFHMSDKQTIVTDRDLIESHASAEILQLGVLFSEYMDVENLIDGFPYSASLQGNTVTVKAIDSLLEKSIRLGYVQTSLQDMIRNEYFPEKQGEIPSVDAFARQLCESYASLFTELKHKPITRYVINLPIIQPVMTLLQDNALFQDELKYLYEISIDNFLNISSLLDVTIDYEVTIMDLVRVRRLFIILARMFSEALKNHPTLYDIDTIDMNSRVPVIHTEQLLNMFDVLFDKKKSRHILNLLTYIAGSEKYFDVQYVPFIKFNNYVMYSLGVMANTNIVRNVFYNHSISIVNTLKVDPMQNAIEYGLKKRGLLVRPGHKGTFGGKQIEVDIIAYTEGHLFIIECKNSFHPCSPHEMRTSFDHVQKAAQQLTRAKNWLTDPSAQKVVFRNIGWNNLDVKAIHTCILTANRLFNGFNIENHPIRHAHELLNVLGSGEIRLEDNFYNIKRGNDFSIYDLVDYLESKSINQIQIESMTPIEVRSDIGKYSLVRKSYAFDFLRMKALVTKNYQAITKEQYENNLVKENLSPANRD